MLYKVHQREGLNNIQELLVVELIPESIEDDTFLSLSTDFMQKFLVYKFKAFRFLDRVGNVFSLIIPKDTFSCDTYSN